MIYSDSYRRPAIHHWIATIVEHDKRPYLGGDEIWEVRESISGRLTVFSHHMIEICPKNWVIASM